MNKNILKSIFCFVVCSIIILITITSISGIKDAKKVSDNVLRLHIIANSDTYEDQNVKIKVRDEILNNTTDFFENTNNIENAIVNASSEINKFNLIANDVLSKNNFEYSANAKVCKSYFPTKVYGDIILPAGTYNAVKVELGDKNGKNWWCMLFPSVCIPTAIKREKNIAVDNLEEDGSLTSTNKTSKGKIRFKIVEIISEIFN